MTPEERANDIVRRCWADARELEKAGDPAFKGLTYEISTAIRQAVAEERERIINAGAEAVCIVVAQERARCAREVRVASPFIGEEWAETIAKEIEKEGGAEEAKEQIEAAIRARGNS